MSNYRAVILIDGSVAVQDDKGQPIATTREFKGQPMHASVTGDTLSVHTDRETARFAIQPGAPHLERRPY